MGALLFQHHKVNKQSNQHRDNKKRPEPIWRDRFPDKTPSLGLPSQSSGTPGCKTQKHGGTWPRSCNRLCQRVLRERRNACAIDSMARCVHKLRARWRVQCTCPRTDGLARRYLKWPQDTARYSLFSCGNYRQRPCQTETLPCNGQGDWLCSLSRLLSSEAGMLAV